MEAKQYRLNVAEAFSQLVNAIHAGEPNDTFSARLAGKRDSGDYGWPGWYWRSWVWLFETCLKGHLDWAKGPD